MSRFLRTLTPEQVGRAIARGVENERALVLTPAELRIVYQFARLAPRLTEWITWRTGARRSAG
jgi:hypothetical protein